MFANHKKENEIYLLIKIEIATEQKKDHQIYSKECKNIKSGFVFSTF
jgi:hypothetical protein